MLPVAEGLLDRRLELEQPQGVGDGRASPPDAGRDVVLGQAELVGQLAVGVRLLHGVEVGTLDVLDEGDGQLVAFGHLADDRRNVVQAGHLSGPDPSLAGHELVAVQDLGDDHRLEDAVDGDAAGQRFEGLLLDALARLVRVAADARDRDLDGRRARRVGLRDQGSQAPPQAGVPLGCEGVTAGSPSATPASRRWRSASPASGAVTARDARRARAARSASEA